MIKNLPAVQETWVRFLGWEDALEKGMAAHASVLAWRILMGRGTWWAPVHGATESQTQLSDEITATLLQCFCVWHCTFHQPSLTECVHKDLSGLLGILLLQTEVGVAPEQSPGSRLFFLWRGAVSNTQEVYKSAYAQQRWSWWRILTFKALWPDRVLRGRGWSSNLFPVIKVVI